MKNHAGFKVGDKVGYLMPTVGGLESLRGLRGTIRYVDDKGAEVVFKTDKGVKVYSLTNYEMIKMDNPPVTTPPTTPREKANDKDNVWAVSIQPAPFDRERTVAYLIVNGRIVDTITVSRWHDEDEYDVGIATYEVVKKMFGIKDKAVEKAEDTAIKEPKWFTGKIVCVHGDSGEFTEGKIYQVNHGILYNNDNFKYGNFESVENINKRLYSQFIEVVE